MGQNCWISSANFLAHFSLQMDYLRSKVCELHSWSHFVGFRRINLFKECHFRLYRPRYHLRFPPRLSSPCHNLPDCISNCDFYLPRAVSFLKLPKMDSYRVFDSNYFSPNSAESLQICWYFCSEIDFGVIFYDAESDQTVLNCWQNQQDTYSCVSYSPIVNSAA